VPGARARLRAADVASNRACSAERWATWAASQASGADVRRASKAPYLCTVYGSRV
jgi:hypothetical protein